MFVKLFISTDNKRRTFSLNQNGNFNSYNFIIRLEYRFNYLSKKKKEIIENLHLQDSRRYVWTGSLSNTARGL
jgi:hypothetical protein